jgi:hypothetical protein
MRKLVRKQVRGEAVQLLTHELMHCTSRDIAYAKPYTAYAAHKGL